MKKTDLTFAEGFLGVQSKIAKENGATQKAFDLTAGFLRNKLLTI